MLIDTHAHVNFRSFKDDAKETLQRALDNGVQVINVGSQIDTSRQAVELANKFETGIYAVVGLHPEHTHSQFVDEEETHFLTREEKFNSLDYQTIARNHKVVGIGECGLDYYHIAQNTEHEELEQIKEKQKASFRAQIKLAKELNKVLVIHSRPAKGSEELYDDILAILDEELPQAPPLSNFASNFAIHRRQGYGGQEATSDKKASSDLREKEEETAVTPSLLKRGQGELRFEIHSYTGSPEYLQKFLDRGAYVSFNGIITFDKTGQLEKLVKLAPLDRILLETDCPYLTPVPNRGKRNEPSFVKFVADKVAQIKNLLSYEVEEATFINAKKLFNI